MVITLVRHELYTITTNKRYMLSLALQLLLLFTLLPVFSNFLSTGTVSLTTPALNEFVILGVVDQSPNSLIIRSSLEKNERIKLINLKSYDVTLLETGKITAILLLTPDYDESLNRVLRVELITNPKNLKAEVVYDAVLPSIKDASAQLTTNRKTAFGVEIENPMTVKKHLLNPLVFEKGAARFSSFFLVYLIPLMLFFPIFTVGSIILDSVVGERESKTFESILVSPVSRGNVVFSKFLSASIFVFVQLLLWLSIFNVYGVPVQNQFLILLMVLVVDSAIIATALLLTYYSQTVKEANIVMMLLYTTIFISLIVSLSINYFNSSLFSTPFTIVSQLAAGGGTNILPWTAVLLIYTALLLSINSRLVDRDDITFGPRPGFSLLLSDLSLWLFSFGKPGYLYLTLIFGLFSLLVSSLLEIAVGIFVVFSFGFTTLLIPIFALIEEIMKPAGIYLLASKKRLHPREGLILGILAGIAFFALESLVFAVATYYLFPARLLAVLKLRISSTLILHALSSGIVGYGIVKKEKYIYFLLIATILHTLFNLLVTRGGGL